MMSTTMKLFLPAFIIVLAYALPALANDIPMAKMNKEGLYVQPWISKTTGDLRKDLKLAQADGKILALLWEQKGCVYCLKMNMVNFRDHKTVNYIKKNFRVIMMNLRGKSKITDFDGDRLSQEILASKDRVNATPVTSYFKKVNSNITEVFRMPGFTDLPFFLNIYEYVAEDGYDKAQLGAWIKARASAKSKN
ncbi:MAG TPA: hypothetical protein ENI79_05725 [Rhodospirillales bacterium]|nr:hypothetical protein [Rhodospirillales bacterium]